MSAPSSPDVSRLAESISDGVKIDWQSEAEHVASEQRSALYILEQIAQLHRETVQRKPSPPGNSDVSEFWGPLEVGELLGQGGFGETHRAFDPMLQRDVALKRAHGEEGDVSLRAWISEARRLARVRHPNVLAVYGAKIYDGKAGIWTELIHGESLSQLVREKGPMSASEAAATGVELCSALSAVHHAGLIHGDVKPSNVLREQGGRIVLLDFGSSRELHDGLLEAGSPAFLAPELVAGKRATIRSDIYAMGVTLYFLVTGKYPVERADPVGTVADTPVPLRDRRPDLPASFVEVVNTALATDPADRFESAALLEAALHGRAAPPQVSLKGRLFFAAAAITLAAIFLWTALLPQGQTTLPGPAQISVIRASASGAAGAVSSGDAIAPGDRLSIQMVLPQRRYAYILNEDEVGNAYVLFPLAHLDSVNPLPGGASHTLPGPALGSNQYWEVTSSGGTERFVVVLSEQPLPKFEQVLAEWQRAGAGSGVANVPEVTLRGVGGLASKPSGNRVSRLNAVLGQLPETDSIEVREFVFRNP